MCCHVKHCSYLCGTKTKLGTTPEAWAHTTCSYTHHAHMNGCLHCRLTAPSLSFASRNVGSSAARLVPATLPDARVTHVQPQIGYGQLEIATHAIDVMLGPSLLLLLVVQTSTSSLHNV